MAQYAIPGALPNDLQTYSNPNFQPNYGLGGIPDVQIQNLPPMQTQNQSGNYTTANPYAPAGDNNYGLMGWLDGQLWGTNPDGTPFDFGPQAAARNAGQPSLQGDVQLLVDAVVVGGAIFLGLYAFNSIYKAQR